MIARFVARSIFALLSPLCTVIVVDVAHAQATGGGATSSGGGGGGGPAKNAIIGGVSGLFLKDEARQGDRDLPGGQTTFAYANLQYNWASYFSGLGIVAQRNQFGTAQTDTFYGLKGELYWTEYYFEAVYGQITQAFEGRSIAERAGTETILGIGRRAPILGGRMHFDLSVKQRSSVIETEDGNDLPDPILRTTLMPYLGLGTSL